MCGDHTAPFNGSVTLLAVRPTGIVLTAGELAVGGHGPITTATPTMHAAQPIVARIMRVFVVMSATARWRVRYYGGHTVSTS